MTTIITTVPNVVLFVFTGLVFGGLVLVGIFFYIGSKLTDMEYSEYLKTFNVER